MNPRPQNRFRSLFAMLCLIAVVLLYAPLGGAAWSLYSAACCTTQQCPIKGHHAQHSPAASEHAMDCSHDVPAMASCSMSCCQHPDRPAVAPIIFVLPTPPTVSATANLEALAPAPDPRNVLSSTKPLSPPPRISTPAA
jgi:hypothetical protein